MRSRSRQILEPWKIEGESQMPKGSLQLHCQERIECGRLPQELDEHSGCLQMHKTDQPSTPPAKHCCVTLTPLLHLYAIRQAIFSTMHPAVGASAVVLNDHIYSSWVQTVKLTARMSLEKQLYSTAQAAAHSDTRLMLMGTLRNGSLPFCPCAVAALIRLLNSSMTV